MVEPTRRPVQVLNHETFTPFLDTNPIVVVAFDLPWLPGYEKFQREFSRAFELLTDFDIRFATVDATKETELSSQFKFRRWPTVKVFQSPNNVKTYEGAWVASHMASFFQRQIEPLASIPTSEALQRFKKSDSLVVVGYFDADDELSSELYRSAAQAMSDEYAFGLAIDANLALQEGITVPSIVLYEQDGHVKRVVECPQDEQALTALIKEQGQPQMPQFYPETHREQTEGDLPICYIVFDDATDISDIVTRTVQPLLSAYKNRMRFGTVNVARYSSIIEDLHMKGERLPAVAIREPRSNRHYPFEPTEGLSKDVVDYFIQQFLNDQLTPTVKSEPVPTVQESPFIVVVANSWNDVVLENDKDVFIEYYTQSCGPCKAVAPVLEKLAYMYSADVLGKDAVTIGKIDAEANDVDGDIWGVPTFKLFPAGAKNKPVMFEDKRTLEAFADFIRDHGGRKVDILRNTEGT